MIDFFVHHKRVTFFDVVACDVAEILARLDVPLECVSLPSIYSSLTNLHSFAEQLLLASACENIVPYLVQSCRNEEQVRGYLIDLAPTSRTDQIQLESNTQKPDRHASFLSLSE